MSIPITKILLWLFVLNLGISLGAGLYESRIQAPQWLTGSKETGYRWNRLAAVEADVGLRFWAFVTTIPLTLLTLASLAALWWVPQPARSWWMAAVAAVLLERAMTFGYFIPTMIRLMSETGYGEPEAAAKALVWVRLGYVRHAANLAGLLAALQAFASFHARSGR